MPCHPIKERMQLQLQGPIITSLVSPTHYSDLLLAVVTEPACLRAVVVMEQRWADAAVAGHASAAQVPFLALLHGAMGDGEAGVNRESYGAASFMCRPAASDVHLLESCVTQAAAATSMVEASAASIKLGTERWRKRPPPEKLKKPEEAECQRMTRIAVKRKRNCRRLMNDHLASLRSLIPSDYIPRSDQVTLLGGAIDYVKQLEQQLGERSTT